MTWFALRNVEAKRWIRTPGAEPFEDNADEIIDFIGRERIVGTYTPSLGTEVIHFRTEASTIGVSVVKPLDWIIFDTHNEPVTVPSQIFNSILSYEIKDKGDT